MNYSALAKSYHPLLYKPELVRALNGLFSTDRYSTYPKRQLHKTINDLLLKNHKGEELFKYRLAKELYARKVVAAFEVPVNKSRLDVLTVGRNTKAFEIKSGRDTLLRLGKQLLDYSAVFEYNYIVTDCRHTQEILDTSAESYGVWSFEGSVKREVRAPQKMTNLNSEAQLNLCNKKELRFAFGSDDKAEILSGTSASAVNDRFKALLKRRYQARWSFLKAHRAVIYPIDLQFFFKTNIWPGLIYESQ